MDAYLRDGRGWSLPRVSREFLSVPGGPELAVLRETGRRLVLQLALTYNNADKNPDLHCVAYDGTAVKDNNQHSKVKEVIASDRSDPASALAVLQSLFKGLKVHVKAAGPAAKPPPTPRGGQPRSAAEAAGDRGDSRGVAEWRSSPPSHPPLVRPVTSVVPCESAHSDAAGAQHATRPSL